MSELTALLDASAALRQGGRSFLLATVVSVRGSSYRRPGARLVLAEGDGVLAGSVSAGCLEADLVRRGFWRTGERPCALVTYDSASDDELGWGLGLGCNGVVELMLERVSPGDPDPLAFHVERFATERAGVLVTVVHSAAPQLPPFTRLQLDEQGQPLTPLPPGVALDPLLAEARAALADRRSRAFSSADGSLSALLEVVLPPPRLFVFGTHPDALPVLALGRTLGWRVTAVADQSRWQTRQNFPALQVLRTPDEIRAAVDACARPVAVVMGHDVERDRAVLEALLTSRALYIGALGPRRRTARLLDDLAQAGLPLSRLDLHRLHAPVGLHLGAETPAEIALSIVGEIQARLSGTSGGFLRDHHDAIHAPPAPVLARQAAE